MARSVDAVTSAIAPLSEDKRKRRNFETVAALSLAAVTLAD